VDAINVAPALMHQNNLVSWRLRSDYVDSGTDHGPQSTSNFFISTVIETQIGHVNYSFSFDCVLWCYLEFYEGTNFVDVTWNEPGDPRKVFTEGPFGFGTGSYVFTWSFNKFYNGRNQDNAKIYKEGLLIAHLAKTLIRCTRSVELQTLWCQYLHPSGFNRV